MKRIAFLLLCLASFNLYSDVAVRDVERIDSPYTTYFIITMNDGSRWLTYNMEFSECWNSQDEIMIESEYEVYADLINVSVDDQSGRRIFAERLNTDPIAVSLAEQS